MRPDSKILVAGASGLVGSSIIRCLVKENYSNILAPTHSDLELMDPKAVHGYFQKNRPDYVFLAAATVGGILANELYPADFIYENLMIQNNIIRQSHVHEVKKLIFLGSSCIYPRNCDQPIKEEYLMTGSLEPTNSAYAIAKIAGIEMCWAYNRQYATQFIPIMPTNLYGPNDNFDYESSHVLPALIRKIHDAKQKGSGGITIWGTGLPLREFLHVDDLSRACLFLMNMDLNECFNNKKPLFNIGTGKDISIKGLAHLISSIIGFKGDILYDTSKPDGTPQKVLDPSTMTSLGWSPKVSLRDGILDTYLWFQKNNNGFVQ